jgi:hypothetical protein
MKTTLDIPDLLFRRVKARAAIQGQSMKVFVVDALRARMQTAAAEDGKTSQPEWRNVYGALKRDRAEVRKVQAIIDEEFEKVNPDDWK